MKISYNWLKWYIPNAPSAEELHDVLTYHLTEVEDMEKLLDGDTIFDINILPNRAHDLLSHSGVGRELSGQLGIPFTDPTKTYTDIMAKREIVKTELQVEVKNVNCRRYSARIVRNIKIGPSPDWVVKHLESIGQRSINNIVDATNLTMYNCGQPTHAFDLRKFADEKVIITNAKENEELQLVCRDAIVAKLKNQDIVIANIDENTLSLAGIKGGTNSGIADDTTDLLIEVANFNPTSIRKTARGLNLLSDSAKRFENDLSPESCDFGMLELSALLTEMCPDAILEEVVDVYPVKQDERKISFTTDFVNKKLGSNVTDTEIENILKNYNFSYTIDGDSFEITVPPLRLDLENSIDMVEEIGRIYGYDKLTPIIPKIDFIPKINETYQKITEIRNHLLSDGYREVMTYSFTNSGEVEVLESASDKNFLRTNLTDGLKASFEMNRLNAPLLGFNEVKIFEIGTVFGKDGEQINVGYANKKEVKEVSINNFSPDFFGKDFYDRSGEAIGNIQLKGNQNSNSFKMWSSYPFITRDISAWVPVGTDASVLCDVYKTNGTDLLVREPQLLDTFTKEDRVSYSYRLVFQAQDRTLTDVEISQIMENITSKILQIKGAEIR